MHRAWKKICTGAPALEHRRGDYCPGDVMPTRIRNGSGRRATYDQRIQNVVRTQ